MFHYEIDWENHARIGASKIPRKGVRDQNTSFLTIPDCSFDIRIGICASSIFEKPCTDSNSAMSSHPEHRPLRSR